MRICLLFLVGLCLECFSIACVYNSEEELYPPETCDTTQVTYSLSVVPIIDYHCDACHGGDAIVSGIPLDGYENIKVKVDDGTLLGAIRHEDGYSPMPENGPMLPDCEILTIEKWVSEGAPNN